MADRKLRVVFVEPAAVEANIFAMYSRLPLLGPLYLGTILKRRGHDVTVLNENILGRPVNAPEIDCDVLCLTGLTSTIGRAYDIAKQYRFLYPKGRIVIGGIHASFLREEAAAVCDTVVSGEAESVIAEAVEGSRDGKFIEGSRVEDLDTVPTPDFSILAGSEKLRIAPIMTSRGCPFACNFCSVTAMFGRKYRTASVERVIEEVATAPGRDIFFYDDNFAVNKARVHKILDLMLARKIRRSWTAQVRADVAADREMLRKMKRAGCTRVYIGIESVSQKSLDVLEKGQRVEAIEQSVRALHESGIKVHGMFVLGTDEDDRSIFADTMEFCRRNRIDSVQYAILTPLPGTPVFAEMRGGGRLLHENWMYYDAMHAVFKPRNMTAAELQAGMIDSFADFYNYFEAANEAFEELANTTVSLLGRLSVRNPWPALYNALIKAAGRAIVKQWRRANADYVAYLERICL